ncbi:hypothetical protein ZIOFF_042008 [Zingiber officinale]|uniref:Uncharacterized protein n=1 Tax=Zingiber officinale TaxID=94328 RepID=A0A8J5KZ98_ZINOF|nr:hypothetical protein ZIOFF_042008 [Zingiber officinale]
MSRSSNNSSRKRGRDHQEGDHQNDRSEEKRGAAVLRPVGIFEFPWQVMDPDGSSSIWNHRRVFFTSLVDGCSASIGVPGDRLFAVGCSFFGLFDEATPSDDETDNDGDCDVWSYVLRHPLLS